MAMLLMSGSRMTIEEDFRHGKLARKKNPATHPGEMLREDSLPDNGLTVSSLAKALRISRQRP